MEETLGSIFDAETRAAWARAYRYLSATMQAPTGDGAAVTRLPLERLSLSKPEATRRASRMVGRHRLPTGSQARSPAMTPARSSSFAHLRIVGPIGRRGRHDLLRRLFDLDPALRDLFPAD